MALVWAVALRGHSSNPSEPAPSSQPSKPASSTPSAPASSPAPGAPSRIYHGPAPGLEGLTRDIAKAHGAVATSERNAAQLGRDSARASGEAATPSSSQSTHDQTAAKRASARQAPARSVPGKHEPAKHASVKHASAKHSRAAGASSKAAGSTGRAPEQIEVEHQLAHGKTVLLLFWDPKSSVDNVVRSQVLGLGKASKGRLAVHTALADQVGLFGTVTEVAHVYQTPTILIVGRHGLVTTLTGLVDEFSLRQAVREAEQANR